MPTGMMPLAAVMFAEQLKNPKIEIDLNIKHHFSDGVYAKQMILPKGHYAISHKHNYEHLSILASGVALVEVDGKGTIYTAPTCINIKADSHHKITAIEDVDWFCIHKTNETDIEKIDKVLIEEN